MSRLEPRDLTVPDGGGPLLFFCARKVLLGEAASLTERHSYDVRLAWNEARREHDVLKRVPSLEQTITRLSTRYADAGSGDAGASRPQAGGQGVPRVSDA